MTDRVVVFIDWQNAYNRAREAFYPSDSPARCGQFNPVQLGHCLARKRPGRELKQVRVYRGIPANKRDPRGYGINRRQTAAWMKTGQDRLEVFMRPLQYLDGMAPREKGIDVQLAIDLVMGAVLGEFDVGILVSADTDLIPALDAVYDFNGTGRPWIEIAGWRGEYAQKRIAGTQPRRVSGLWIEESDFDLMRDNTDYNMPK